MNMSEEKEVSLITMRHIRALAGKQGYHVRINDTYLCMINKSDEQISRSFDLHAPFRIDPPYTQQCTFMRISLWIRGYDLTYEEPITVRIEPARHHPAWHPGLPRQAPFVYQGAFLLFGELAAWVSYLETHHCPFMDRLPLQEDVPVASSEHRSI